MAKESLECTFGDNINAAEKRAELRETELNALVDSLQAKNGMFNCFYFSIIFKRRNKAVVCIKSAGYLLCYILELTVAYFLLVHT